MDGIQKNLEGLYVQLSAQIATEQGAMMSAMAEGIGRMAGETGNGEKR